MKIIKFYQRSVIRWFVHQFLSRIEDTLKKQLIILIKIDIIYLK